MRKRYQKVERTRSNDGSYETRTVSQEPPQETVAPKTRKPRTKPVSMLFLRDKNKDQDKSKLHILMAALVIILLGINAALSDNIAADVGDFFGEIFGIVKVFIVIALVGTPVVLFTMFLNKFLPEKVASWIGALILLGLMFGFFIYVAASWGV